MNLGDLFVTVGAKIDGFKQAMGEVKSTVSSTEPLFSKFGVTAGLGLAAIGTAAFAAATKFDNASVAIQNATGATGERLKDLESSFRNVYRQVDESATQVSEALALLATRTGQTGKPLEDLTIKLLDLAKVQREGVSQLTPAITRAFGDWSIATENQAAAMDFLGVVSQQTGVRVARLAEQVVSAGAPLRELGYSFEGATALISKFEKEGVNTELVLGGMKAALQKFAKEGVTDTAAEWQKLIQGVKDGTVSFKELQAVVGAKRGVDLFKAITEGRFEIEATAESFKNLAKEGLKTADTIGEQFTKATHALEGFVAEHSALITAIGLGAPLIGNAVKGVMSLGGAFTSLTALFNPVTLGLTAAAAAATVLYIEFGKATSQVQSLDKAFGEFVTKMVTNTKDFEGSRAKLDAALANNALTLGQYNQALAILEDREKKALGKELTEQFGLGLTIVGKEAPKAAEGVEKLGTATTGLKKTLKESTVALHEFVGPMTPLLDKMIAAESAARAQARLRKLVDEVVNLREAGLGVGMDLEVVWSDLSHNVEDFREQVIETTPVIAQMVDIDPTKGEQAMQRIKDALSGAATTGKTKFNELARDMEMVFSRAFAGLEQSLARMITDWKFSFDTIKKLGQDFAEGMLNVFFKALFQPLEDQFAKLGAKIGGILGDLLGGGGGAGGAVSGAAGAAGTAGGAGGGAGGAAGAATGLAGTLTAIGSIGSMITGAIGLFQNARLEGTMNGVELNTRITAIEVSNLRRDEWDRETHNMAKWDDIWGTLLDIYDLMGQWVMPAVPEYGAPALATGTAPFEQSVTINVSGASDPESTSRAVAAHLKRVSPKFANLAV